MTREEEIEKASDKYIEDYLKSSNEYPLCDNRKRMSLIQVDLYKMQETFENGMKETDRIMLDRACEWLNKILYIHTEIEEDKHWCKTNTTNWVTSDYDTVEEFITAFRQAMEGGAE
jgi:hypothetical protein